eukprot:11170074-Lingulodinium_polyedra.AAC.1
MRTMPSNHSTVDSSWATCASRSRPVKLPKMAALVNGSGAAGGLPSTSAGSTGPGPSVSSPRN